VAQNDTKCVFQMTLVCCWHQAPGDTYDEVIDRLFNIVHFGLLAPNDYCFRVPCKHIGLFCVKICERGIKLVVFDFFRAVLL